MHIVFSVPLYCMFPCGPCIRLLATSKGIFKQEATVPDTKPRLT